MALHRRIVLHIKKRRTFWLKQGSGGDFCNCRISVTMSQNISDVTNFTEPPCEPKICEVGGGGLLLPLFAPDEQEWNIGLRAVLYFTGLLWSFMGVGIVSDIFMGAIEKVTSRKKRVFSSNLQTFITVKVWNATVANLTLMALGSSAPEILLSVIELLSNEMYAGDLGPSTIVGSAAFNLLCITAVCVSAIPEGEVRRIKDIGVFAVTASFSIFAYLWLLIICMIWTPDAKPACFVTAKDKGYLTGQKQNAEQHKVLLDAATEQDTLRAELATMRMRILRKHGTGLPDAALACLMARDLAVLGKNKTAHGTMVVVAWFFHLVTMPWKLASQRLAPLSHAEVDYCGGWLCFVCSLSMIGGVTALIGRGHHRG
eukprot:Skav203083  [mRNA]  locus=scaffold447:48061:63460:- [translate_table: standard]